MTKSQPDPVSAQGGGVPDARDFQPKVHKGKPTKLTDKDRAALGQFLTPIRQRIAEMDAMRLNAVVSACLNVSQTNCSWQDFAIADIVFWGARARLADLVHTTTPQPTESEVRKDGGETA